MKKVLAVLLAVGLLLGMASPVLAIADPDSPPQVSAVYVYEFSDGSVGVLIDYYLDYGTLPDETVTEAYLAVFVDTDGTTQLKSVAPYTFVDSGYGRGMVWIPFTSAEATAAGLDSASIADYRIWLTGNPTVASGWTGDPPKTITTIDQWVTTDVSATLTSRILYYADVLELAWSLDMVENTADGNKLTSAGESYFTNVITGLRTLAPGCFSDTTSDPDYISISYDSAFGAVAISGTATLSTSPQTLAEGTDSIDTVGTTGTVIIGLAQWTSGNITDDTGTLSGGPTVDLYPGVNTLVVTGAGTFTTELEVIDSSTVYEDTVTGTGFDLTDLATAFGMSRWMLSGLIWMLVSVVACAVLFVRSSKGVAGTAGATKQTTLLFTIMLVGGMLLGMVHPLVVSFALIATGAFIGYVLFFRSETLHKGFMFMMWMFIIVSIAGNIAASGQSGITTTRLVVPASANLTADIDAFSLGDGANSYLYIGDGTYEIVLMSASTESVTTGTVLSATETDSIQVASTAGFPSSGIIVIDDEQIAYPDKDDTHFLRTTFNPIVRGSGGTTAVEHDNLASVRTKESYMLNASLDYKIARITDSAGGLAFIAMPFLLLDLVLTFFKLPLEFLGTDLAILTYIWMVVAVGMIVGFIVALVGGRRV